MNNYILLSPTYQFGITKGFVADKPKENGHAGIDIGWYSNPNQPIYACHTGKVVWVNYDTNRGHEVYIEDDEIWTGYIHLNSKPVVKQGEMVKAGQLLGYMGKSGITSNYEHLHLYLSEKKGRRFSWNTMRTSVIDPLPHIYFDRNIDYYIAEGYRDKVRYIQELYPTPVKREEGKWQVQINSDTRNLREGPGLSAKKYSQYCKRGIYNVNKTAVADNYIWANIADGYWVAVMETDGNYPAVDYKILYQNLKDDLTIYLTQKDELIKQRDKAYEEIEDLKSTIKIYTTQKEVLIDRLEKALSEIKGV
jgi:hypothetical protein